MNFLWDFGSTLQDPNKLYTNTGILDSVYLIELISESMHGCKDTFVDSITIHPDARADFNPTSSAGCAPLTLDSTLIGLTQYPLANDTYSWTIFDSDSSTVLSSFNGTSFTSYTMANDNDTTYVRLITSNNYGCKNDTIVKRFITIQDPQADFTLSDSIGCGNTQITLSDASTPSGLALNWSFGDGDSSTATNPTHTFNNTSNTQDSTYNITLIVTASSGCSDTTVKQFISFGKPLAKFNAIEVCEYKSTIFTDSSLVGGTTITNWAWDFDDSNQDTLQNTSHTYNQDGTYNVKLRVTNGYGCIDSVTNSILSYPIPILSFAHDTLVCAKDSIFFNNITTGASQYEWDFGNGNADNRKSPNAYFDTLGYYIIKHVATTSFGCYDSLSSSIQVIEAPKASYVPSIDEGCAPLEVIFSNTTIAEYSTYFWDYGQGQTSTGSDADTILYQQGRNDTTYYIQLVVSNQCKVDTFIDSVLVHPTPVAIFETNKDIGCSPLNILISNNLTYGDPDSLIWDFGDGSSTIKTIKSTFYEPLSHSYTTLRLPSIYTITYIAKNECGADTAFKDIQVFKNVEAFFNTDTLSGCFPLTVNFTNSSRGYVDYAWDFGDGNTSNVNNPKHTFNQSGTFTVKLFVTDSCSYDTFTQQVLVYPEPILSFDFIKDSICQLDSIRFLNTSNNISGTYWDFGDGGTSIVSNPIHQFNSAGTFNVSFTGYSTLNNCPASINKDVHILPRPTASITANPTDGCQPLTVRLLADSSYNSWSFSNGNISSLNKPLEVFYSAGVQWAKLISEYANGCKDSTRINLVVHPRPLAGFIASVDSLCSFPTPVDYFNTSMGALGYNWKLGNGDQTTATNPSILITAPGIYNDTLIASNQFGCLDTATNVIKIYNPPIANAILSPQNGCLPLDVEFTNLSTNYLSNTWYFGNGDSSNQANELYTYTTDGSYTPSLIVYGNANCSDTFTFASSVDVYPNPIADFDFEVINVSTTFTNYSTGADSYIWDFGDGETSTLENLTHKFPESGSFTTTLIARNNFGCKDTLTKTIDILEIYNLFVSNAFSPEFGPPEVRQFKPRGIGIAEYHIYIYDTWGNLLWESDKLSKSEPAEGWDGKDLDGNTMPQDTYVWKATATFLNGRIWPGKIYSNGQVKRYGTVTLIR
mgnify:FL=1